MDNAVDYTPIAILFLGTCVNVILTHLAIKGIRKTVKIHTETLKEIVDVLKILSNEK